jgi:hypothetical protein
LINMKSTLARPLSFESALKGYLSVFKERGLAPRT